MWTRPTLEWKEGTDRERTPDSQADELLRRLPARVQAASPTARERLAGRLQQHNQELSLHVAVWLPSNGYVLASLVHATATLSECRS